MDNLVRILLPSISQLLPAGARVIAVCKHPADRQGNAGCVVKLASGRETWTLTGQTMRSINPRDWRKGDHEMVSAIECHRYRLRLTQADAAARCKPPMTQSHWADIEGGRRSPTLDTLARVAAALGCQVRDLV
jgi:hypothetical protein